MQQELSDFNDSVYRQEFTVEKLEKQLGILACGCHSCGAARS